ncbi:MAG: wax ester/triacylglycerol synthase domain-containing protein [Ilumatobacteraceae bacterium]
MSDDREYDDWMSATDAIAWHVERDPVLRSTITTVWFLDRRPDDARFRAGIDRAVARIPRLRQRVVEDPLGVTTPRWVEVDDFEVDRHVHVEELDHTPAEAQVMAFAGPMHSRPFDKDQPLWELHLLHGPDDGPAAMVVKLHHAIADGLGLVNMVTELVQLDRDGAPTAVAGHVREPAPDQATALADAVAHRARSDAGLTARTGMMALRNLSRMTVDPIGEIRRNAATATSIARTLKPATTPMSALMSKRSLEFALSTTSRELAGVRTAAKAAGGTINDVFVAAVIGAVQRYHDRHGTSLEQLRLSMPISVRAAGDETAGNQFVPARFLVPADIADPEERIRTLGRQLIAERAEPALGVVGEIAEVVQRLGPQAATALLGGMMKAADLTTSNVPGIDVPLYLAGARIDRMVPCGPCAGTAVNVTLLSYDGRATLGITADRAAIPDTAEFTACLDDSLDEILALGPT